MHASMAYVNGAGEKRRNRSDRKQVDSLALLHTLLAGSTSVDERKSQEEKKIEEESKAQTSTQPGGFHNDPDDPKNPNEVRERHQRKVRP